MNFRIIVLFNLLATALVFSSCYVPPNLDDVKNEIMTYYENGSYDSEMNNSVQSAISELSGLEFNDSTTVVFDVDETVLSNYDVMKKDDFCYIKQDWDNWINEIRCKAVPHMLTLYQFLLDKKVKIVFLTGRKEYQQEATEINLRSEGFIKF